MSMAQHIRRGDRLAPYHYALDEPQWRSMIEAIPGWFIAHWCDDCRAYVLFLDQETPLMARAHRTGSLGLPASGGRRYRTGTRSRRLGKCLATVATLRFFRSCPARCRFS